MFSSIFGKLRTPAVEEDTPPIPGPRNDDSFVVVNPTPPPANIYPNVSGGGNPSYYRPAPVPPIPRVAQAESSFHYLQGVPFQLSRQLQMSTNKDAITSEIADLLAFLTNRMRINNVEYDFSVEKSVLKEC